MAEHGAEGLFALPAGEPRGIVAFAHGYGHTAESWRQHIIRTAKTNGVIAFAVNYPGEEIKPGPERPVSTGWHVSAGARAALAVSRYFDATCGSKGTNVMYGVSMGGNTSGLAVAAKQKRANGQPLFDWWFNIEGATHVTETYLAARALAVSGNATAKSAVADIDGLVGSNQSREMQAVLRQQGVPVEFVSVVTQQNNESGTTLDGYLAVPGRPASPFAGHASEVSYTHVVGRAGFDALDALYAGKAPRCGETLLDVDSRQESTVSTC
jgi:predicted alpha/beta-hydrolase family hydrolase